jgi:uncharacterized protein (TIGR02145 family)
MKKQFTSIVLLLSAFSFAQVGIGTTTPNASAILDITSTSKGLLPPRMNTEQRNIISNPTEGLTIYKTNLKSLETYNGMRWINYRSITSTDVLNPITDKIWMDRNLGALEVATSSIDFYAYGSLFQWGRAADGHQLMNWTSSSIVTPVNGFSDIISSSDSPDTTEIILATGYVDWRNPTNENLWQGVNGINNPCPTGYRLPTEIEWEEERFSWSSNNAAGAYASPLKLPNAGNRPYYDRDIWNSGGGESYYWSSTARYNFWGDPVCSTLKFQPNNAAMFDSYRACSLSIRCIKN